MASLVIFLIFNVLTSVMCSNLLKENKTELEQYIEQNRLKVNQRYRLQYHVAPPIGWINDPNGFSFYKDQYHLFFQYYPYEAEWGPMHWGHVTSKDLVNWVRQPTALLPGEEQCFSGSAVVDNGTLVLIYTGHVVIKEEPFQNQSQYLAFSHDGINFDKYVGNPVISASPTNSPHFRDPKVWKHENYWYAVIGEKTSENLGRVLLYRSLDLKSWEYLNVLAESNGTLGYMWECPDFFELNGKHILLMSPQGIEAQGDRYKNTYQTGYIVGTFDYENHKFKQESDFQELDYGHDFYATQTIEHNGTRLLVAWMGMWEVPHPEAEDGWVCAMTLIRKLELDSNNRLLMSPINAQASLRNKILFDGQLNSSAVIELPAATELLIKFDLKKNINLLLEGSEGGNKTWLRWNIAAKKVVVQRDGNDVRQVEWSPSGDDSWRLFLDTSSLELFCGKGDVVFSSRVYPLGGWKLTNVGSQAVNVTSYLLNRSVESIPNSSFMHVDSFSLLIFVLALFWSTVIY